MCGPVLTGPSWSIITHILKGPRFSAGTRRRSVLSWQNRKVVITGATGFVGCQAALELSRLGADVVALTLPTSDVARLRAAGVERRSASLDDAADLARCLHGC